MNFIQEDVAIFCTIDWFTKSKIRKIAKNRRTANKSNSCSTRPISIMGIFNIQQQENQVQYLGINFHDFP